VVYTVVRLVTDDCTNGLSTRYSTVDSTIDIGKYESQRGIERKVKAFEMVSKSRDKESVLH